MTKTPEEKFFDFINKSIRDGIAFDRPCERIALHQTSVSGANSVLHVEEIEEDISIYGDEKIHSLVRQFLDLAEQDADGFGDPTTFQLVAFFKGDNRAGKRSPTIRLAPEATENTGTASEPANLAGICKQLMRHNEALMRSNIQSQDSTIRHLSRTNEVLTARMSEMEEKHFEVLRLQEELLSQRQERELADKLATSKDVRMGEVIGLLKKYGPTLINRLSDKKLLPETTTPEADIFRNVVDKITPKQLSEIKDILGPDNSLLLNLCISDPTPSLEIIKKLLTRLDPKQIEDIAGILGQDAIPLMDLYMRVTDGVTEESEETKDAEFEPTESFN